MREQTGRPPERKSKVKKKRKGNIPVELTLDKEREKSREMRERDVGLFMPMLSRFRSFLFFLGFIAFFILFYILCGHHYVRSVIIHFNYICRYVDFRFFFNFDKI